MFLGGICWGVLFELIIIDKVSKDVEMVWEELFGLLVLIFFFVDFDEVIDIVNYFVFGFLFGVVINNFVVVLLCVKWICIGIVNIN